jgi:hypothetical protein
MQARRIQAQFGGRLRAAQQQHGEQGDSLAGHAQHAVQVVLETRNAAAAAFEHKAQMFEVFDCAQHFGFAHVHDRRARSFLVAAGGQRIERQRIGVRHRVLFLDQHADDAGLQRRERAQRAGRGSIGRGIHKRIGRRFFTGFDHTRSPRRCAGVRLSITVFVSPEVY